MKLGTWGANLSTKAMEYFIDGCLDMGLPMFDHADIYGDHTTEEAFGNVVRRRPDLKNRVQLISKCGIVNPSVKNPVPIKHYNSSKSYITPSIEQSLKNLGTDHLELFLIHRPDSLLNPYEVAEAIDRAKEAGKIKHFGVSNFSPSQFDLLNTVTPLATNQIEASTLHLEPFMDGTLDQLYRLGKTPTAWSPMGGGAIFTSKDERSKRILTVANELANIHSCSVDQILIAWLLRHPSGIVPVMGSTNLDRLKSASDAQGIVLSHEDWYKLWIASTGQEVA